MEAFSQLSGNELYEKVMNELTKKELDNVKPYYEYYEQADNLMQESDKMLQDIARIEVIYPHASPKEQKQYDKQFKKLEEKSIENVLLASGVYTQADTLFFNIIYKKIPEIEKPKMIATKQLADKLVGEAVEHIEVSKKLTLFLNKKKISNFDVLKTCKAIKHLQNLAILKISRVFGLYLKWNDIVSFYQSELKLQEAENNAFGVFTQNEDSSVTYSNNVIYRIQISSKKSPLTQEEINNYQEKFGAMTKIIDNNWINYNVGNFSTFQEAFDKIDHEEWYITTFKKNSPQPLIKILNEKLLDLK
jgi:hypothetical protein